MNIKRLNNSVLTKPELRYGKMKTFIKYGSCASLLAMLMFPLGPVQAAVHVQCPGDDDGDADWTAGETRPFSRNAGGATDSTLPPVACMHLSAGDGFSNMGDGYLQYIFGFGDLTGTLPDDAVDKGILKASISAPTIVLEEGQEFFLSLTNTGMVMRPDLFDPHTVHFHGFPNASSIFDGVPDVSVSINMGSTFTYYYNVQEPGTYLYHCHVEAAEHMQMGMQGNLYVHPAQDGTSIEYPLGSGRTYTKFVYNDVDGSTGYDVEYPLQLTGFDPIFHDASMNTQPLPFADMNDTYHMFNGRGYPATVQNTNYYNPDSADFAGPALAPAQANNQTATDPNGYNSQPLSSKMTVAAGQKLLIRLTNLSITHFNTVTVLGLPMKVIGQGGRELADKYDTASVNLGGGEAYDVVIDTLGVKPGTYYMYITELNDLSNNQQSFGGPMTEIVVSPAI
jgi:FtsP/CotA-like multicopper oxidase with cupredoxin domain